MLDNAIALEGEWDFIVIHDPQPAAIREFIRGRAADRPDTKWIWRCHIDLTDANPTVWDFYQPFVEQYDASVWTMPQFVPASLTMDNDRARAAVHRPTVGEEPRPRLDPFVDGDRAAATACAPTTRCSCR